LRWKTKTVPQRIANYDLIQKLGAGRLGTVHMAMDTVLNRMVAIKILGDNEQSMDAEREAFVTPLSRVRTACLGAVYTTSPIGHLPVFLVREYIAGVGLDRLLSARSQLPEHFTTAIVWGIANALRTLHEANQVHGNIKKSNVFLRQSGGVKLVDPWFPTSSQPEVPQRFQDATVLGPFAVELWSNSTTMDSVAMNAVPALCRDAVNQCILCTADTQESPIALLESQCMESLTTHGLTPQSALKAGVEELQSVFLMSNLGASPVRASVPEPAVIPDVSPTEDAVDAAVPQSDGFERLRRNHSPPEVEQPSDDSLEVYALHDIVTNAAPEEPPAVEEERSMEQAPEPIVPAGPSAKQVLSETADNVLFKLQEWRSSIFIQIMALLVVGGGIIFWLLPSPSQRHQDTPTNGQLDAQSIEKSSALEESIAPDDVLGLAKLRVSQNPKDGEAQLALAQAYFDANKWSACREVLKEAAVLLPESPRPLQLSIRLLLETDQSAEAVIQARAASKQYATDASIHMLLARGLLAQQRTMDAAKSLEVAVQINASLSEAWNLLGKLHLDARQFENARIAYERAVEEDPKNTVGYIGLGRSLLALGRGDDTVDALVAGLSITEDDPELKYTTARILLFGNRLTEAKNLLLQCKQQTPKDWRIDFNLSLILLRQGQYDESLALFNSMEPPEAHQGSVQFNKAVVQVKLGKYRDALDSFNAAAKLYPSQWQVHCERAKLHHHLSRWESARVGYEQTLTLNPSSVIARAMLETRLDSPLAHLQLGLPCHTALGIDILDG